MDGNLKKVFLRYGTKLGNSLSREIHLSSSIGVFSLGHGRLLVWFGMLPISVMVLLPGLGVCWHFY